jgi:hypothetical protein
VEVFARSDRDRVDSGARPQPDLIEPGAATPGFAQLLGKHQPHLAAVLLAKRRGVAMEQGVEPGMGAHLRPPHQTGRARLLQHRVQALHFGRRDAFAEFGEPIVSTPLVGARGIGLSRSSSMTPCSSIRRNRAVERAGAQLHLAIGPPATSCMIE